MTVSGMVIQGARPFRSNLRMSLGMGIMLESDSDIIRHYSAKDSGIIPIILMKMAHYADIMLMDLTNMRHAYVSRHRGCSQISPSYEKSSLQFS